MQEEKRVAQLTPEQKLQEAEEKLRQNVAALDAKQFTVFDEHLDYEISYGE